MLPTAHFTLEGIDDETMEEFISCLYDDSEGIETDLMLLERDPTNVNRINSLFRHMHTIKGNCRMCNMGPLADYTHAMEDVVSDLRARRLTLNTCLKEALLIGLDHVKQQAETLAQVGEIATSLTRAVQAEFAALALDQASACEQHSRAIICLLSGMDPDATQAPAAAPTPATRASKPQANTPDHEDLAFFKRLAEQVDAGSPFWDGRAAHILQTALTINTQLDTPVDPVQLTAAVYLHDVGMNFVPHAVVHKHDKLNAIEERQLQQHVDNAWELVRRMPRWQAAAEMVRHHHERIDGSGYPQHLKGLDICTGGKILAVADTYFSITNERADRSYKRSLLRAITEINSCVNSQFDGAVVAAFNSMIRQRHPKKDEERPANVISISQSN